MGRKREGEKLGDWTIELFVENAELYLRSLEKRVPQAPVEVKALLERLSEQGFEVRRVLDLNCGIGRHSIELARRGIEVLGTDISPLYIKIARERARSENVHDKARFLVADMREIARTLSREEAFDGIINLFTSFGYYDDETNDDILRQCRRLVREGGFFALETANKDWIVKNFLEQSFHWEDDLLLLEEREFDPYTSRIHNTWTYLQRVDEKTYTLKGRIKFDHRVWSLNELIEMFRRTGWSFKAAYPGLNEEKNTPLTAARRLLIIAQR
ncbi:class I SAM-dependent methyltransferase [Infirmifilum lucidum]|uniref:Class I SAM-dependent methyltransferase n=1 Tax=Infirmifilum lucidum TaxID=2776706 RepID=A0A7L9FGA8_9CREN|nr:class I SAM-dependent methyltransferase [Infirmifilum lucidum]QOJ78789.1 class I SAM-dependent methyltransferase [Infirmifilum lucidum]